MIDANARSQPPGVRGRASLHAPCRRHRHQLLPALQDRALGGHRLHVAAALCGDRGRKERPTVCRRLPGPAVIKAARAPQLISPQARRRRQSSSAGLCLWWLFRQQVHRDRPLRPAKSRHRRRQPNCAGHPRSAAGQDPCRRPRLTLHCPLGGPCGASVQLGLSDAGATAPLISIGTASDKRYSLGRTYYGRNLKEAAVAIRLPKYRCECSG